MDNKQFSNLIILETAGFKSTKVEC